MILHEGDQRRHDECDSVEDHRRQLVAERLAAARGHDDDGVFAREDRLNYFMLAFAEVVEAKVLAQRSDCVCERVHERVL